MKEAPFREFEKIVEYSYHPKYKRFVIRFLDGSSYALKTADLPKKLQTKKPQWEETALSADRSCLLVVAGSDVRQIPSHIIHSRGQIV